MEAYLRRGLNISLSTGKQFHFLAKTVILVTIIIIWIL